jgi:hypothetical protein
MKISYKLNKIYPEVQYVATLDPLPMATTNPELTEAKVTKKRFGSKGITVEEQKEFDLSFVSFCYHIFMGYNLRDITSKYTGNDYTFDHKIIGSNK